MTSATSSAQLGQGAKLKAIRQNLRSLGYEG